MTTRRNFLAHTLSLAASPYIPASAGQLAAQAVASGGMSAAVSATALPSIHVERVAEIAVTAFDMGRVYEIETFPLFRNVKELRQSGFGSLEEYFTNATFDNLHDLVEGLKNLPEGKRTDDLDGFAYNVMQMFAERLSEINHLLIYSDEHLVNLKSDYLFQGLLASYSDESDSISGLKALGAENLSREFLLSELELVLTGALDMAAKMAALRMPQDGIPANGPGYMTALMKWHIESQIFMPAIPDEVSAADLAQSLKIWMEQEFLKRNLFRLGSYDVPEDFLEYLKAAADELGADINAFGPLPHLASDIAAEEAFGSADADMKHFVHLSTGAVRPDACRVVDQVVKPKASDMIRLHLEAMTDLASARFNINALGAGIAVTREVIEELKALFPSADIQTMEITPEAGTEGPVLQISYKDSQGQAQDFSDRLASALKAREREMVARTAPPSRTPPDDAPGPENQPFPG